MRTLQAGFVGFLVTLIALMFIAEKPEYAIQIVGFSIICTLGASLLLWIPLWIAVGYFCFSIPLLLGKAAGLNSSKLDNPDGHDDLEEVEAPATSPSHASLLEYVTRAKQAGMHEKIIFKRLLTKGWNAVEIYSALRRYEKLTKKLSKIS